MVRITLALYIIYLLLISYINQYIFLSMKIFFVSKKPTAYYTSSTNVCHKAFDSVVGFIASLLQAHYKKKAYHLHNTL